MLAGTSNPGSRPDRPGAAAQCGRSRATGTLLSLDLITTQMIEYCRLAAMSVFVSATGRSHSGKTAPVEKLIAEIKRRGHTVATVKHRGGGFEFDRTGRDNWRPTEAGSDVAVPVAPRKLPYMERPAELVTLEEVAAPLGDRFDLTLVEGFKERAPSRAHSGISKVEVHRKQLDSVVSPPEELFALVTDEDWGLPMPHFYSTGGAGLADLLVREIGGTRR